MLTMRNGLSLHPGYVPGSLPSTLVSQSGVAFDEGNILLNTSRRADTLSQEQEIFRETAFETSHHASSSQPIFIPSTTTNFNSQIPAGFTPPVQNNYGLLNHLASSKVTLLYTWSKLWSLTIFFMIDTMFPRICRIFAGMVRYRASSWIQISLVTIHHQACLHREWVNDVNAVVFDCWWPSQSWNYHCFNI